MRSLLSIAFALVALPYVSKGAFAQGQTQGQVQKQAQGQVQGQTQEQAQVVTSNSKESQSKESLNIFVVPTEYGVTFELPAGNPSYMEWVGQDGQIKREPLAVKSLKIGEKYSQEINGVKINLCPEVSKTLGEKQVRVTFQRPGSRDFVYLLKRTPGPSPSLTAEPVTEKPEIKIESRDGI